MKNNSFKKFNSTLLLLFIAFYQVFSQDEVNRLPTRDQIDPKYTWNLADVYASDSLWEKDYKWVSDNLKGYKNFEGKLGNSSKDLLAALKFEESLLKKLYKIYLYANSAKDLDLSNSVNNARYDKAIQLFTQLGTYSSFMSPEILDIPQEKLDRFINESSGLKEFKHQLNNLVRSKKHVLAKDQEELLAKTGQITKISSNTVDVFTNSDLQFPIIKDANGKDFQLSDGRLNFALESSDRSFRERALEGFRKSYYDYRNTLASLLYGQVKVNMFYSNVRKYNSSLEAALDGDSIPVAVYNNLVKTVNENLKPLQRWHKIRKTVLGYKEYYPYDYYVTLFPGVKKEYSYDSAVVIVKNALKPLGDDYIKNLTYAFEHRWVDVHETKGKMSGAYSTSVSFETHPFVLLNWNNTLDDVFTLAHEMGHTMHTFYAEKTQPLQYASYSTFVAEVASTCNEALLLDYLIEKATSKEEKLALIEKYIQNITLTFYRQVMLAEIEKVINENAEMGESLTSDLMMQICYDIDHKYGGPDIILNKESLIWAYVPHFYYNFYVYQYATSFSASQYLFYKIKNEKQPAIDKYLTLLKSGGSDYPINLLKNAGIDMSSPEPIVQTIHKMNELLDEMEKLLAEK
jgi:oligoendopeptidase F